VTVNVRDPSGVQVVAGAAATEVGDGFYTYTLTADQTTKAGTYRARFLTGDATVDQKELPAIWILGKPWVARVDAAVSSRSTFAGGAVAGVTAPVTVGSVQDKAGYALAPTGLDAIPIAAPAGVAGTFREMMVALHRRFFAKSTLTATQLQTYADDGVTVLTTQPVSDDGTTQTQGAAR
jgi:hypothetical protein